MAPFLPPLCQVPNLPRPTLDRLWGAAVAHVASLLLEGLAGVRRCSPEGRAAMSLDLQAVGRALAQAAPPGSSPPALRRVDDDIKVGLGV